MKLEINVIGRKTEVTYNGKTTVHKTVFLKSLSYKDAINYLTE